MNRRDLLKFFGAGALIVPVVEGIPGTEVAKLIEVPRVEPVEFKPSSGFPAGECECVLYMRERTGGRTSFSFNAYTVKMEQTHDLVDVGSGHSNVRRLLPTYATSRMLLEITASVRMQS